MRCLQGVVLMALQHRSTGHLPLHVFWVLLLAGVAWAQEDVGDASAGERFTTSQAEAAETRIDDVDEIVVTGARTLRNLMALGERLTLNFYDLLNDAIDDPEFRINCTYESTAGTRIRRQVCRPRYVENESGRVARQQFRQMQDFGMASDGAEVMQQEQPNAIPGDFDPGDLRLGVMREKQDEFNERILEAVNADPALNRAFWELAALREEIEELRGR
jgi:hypothetical protein